MGVVDAVCPGNEAAGAEVISEGGVTKDGDGGKRRPKQQGGPRLGKEDFEDDLSGTCAHAPGCFHDALVHFVQRSLHDACHIGEGSEEQAKSELCNINNKFSKPKLIIHIDKLPLTETGKPARAKAMEFASKS